VVVLAEHLGPHGLAADARDLLTEREGWPEPDVDLLASGLRLYFRRTHDLARRTVEFSVPLVRNLVVVLAAGNVRPFASLLNVGAWTLDRSDLDALTSHPEVVAWLLALGDRLRTTPDATLAPIQIAAWWFERSEAERAAFTRAVQQSTRPDADCLRTFAASIPHLRDLRHDRLRPVHRAGSHRRIHGTGLLVPPALEAYPPRLAEDLRLGSLAALEAFHRRQGGSSEPAVRELCEWLRDTAPPLVVAGRGGRIHWSRERADRCDLLADLLREAPETAVRSMYRELAITAERTTSFLSALVAPEELAPTDLDAAQEGYVFMHPASGLLAYDPEEPGIERLRGPGIPWAAEMLGARCLHEWAHRAVDSGWVPRVVGDEQWRERLAGLAGLLEEAVAKAPRELRAHALEYGSPGSTGAGLAARFAQRLPDHASNLLAAEFWSPVEREVYVAQNVRPLGAFYPPQGVWNKLVRHLYEMQYLAFSSVPDPLRAYASMTDLGEDLDRLRIGPGEFAGLARAAAEVCEVHRIDDSRIRRREGREAGPGW